MIESTVADVVGPTVTTHDPQALADQSLCGREQIAPLGSVGALQLVLQSPHAFALLLDAVLVGLVCAQQRRNQFAADASRELPQQ